MSGESCLIFNWHSSRAASGISFFRAPTKDDEYKINWRNNIVAVITCDTRQGDEGNLKTQHFGLNYHQEKLICYKYIIPIKLHFLLH